MTKTTLDAIATTRARLEEELRDLDKQEEQLRQQQASDAYANVMQLLTQFGAHFSAKQKAELVTALNSGERAPRKKASSTKEVAPKYWLPHSGETWSGRGRAPRAFAAWEGTAAYKEWKARHPNEKFPKFPG